MEKNDKLLERMENCKHQFVRMVEGYFYYADNTTDSGYEPAMVKCVHCGLTNQYLEYDLKKLAFSFLVSPSYYHLIKTNNEVFLKQFRHGYTRSGKGFDENVFNFLSEEVIKSYHPDMLYKMAKMINENASDEELFEIMKGLKSIETVEEECMFDISDRMSSIIERYNSKHSIVLKQ